MNLNEKDIKDSLRKNVMLLYNVYNFYELANYSGKDVKSKELIDKWILSRMNELLDIVTENMEKYDLPSATRPITDFIENLSWYVRVNRDRINSGNEEALGTLRKVLEKCSRIFAPFMPYVSEHIWQGITGNNFGDKSKSVHLENWPKSDKSDSKLNDKMKLVREIISLGLKERDKEKVSLKQPLKSINVCGNLELEDWMKEIIGLEVNVKNVLIKRSKEIRVELDLELTPELEAEGFARQISREIQAFRKKLGLKKEDKIRLILEISEKFKGLLEGQKGFIKDRTNASELELSSVNENKETFKKCIEFDIKGKRGRIIVVG